MAWPTSVSRIIARDHTSPSGSTGTGRLERMIGRVRRHDPHVVIDAQCAGETAPPTPQASPSSRVSTPTPLVRLRIEPLLRKKLLQRGGFGRQLVEGSHGVALSVPRRGVVAHPADAQRREIRSGLPNTRLFQVLHDLAHRGKST